MTPGFHFSVINQAMVSQNPADSLNILWNQLNEDLKAKSSLFMTPNFDPSIGYTYPEFGAFGNSLLDPQLAIKQTLQSFQNGSWMKGNNGNVGGFGNFTSPWGNFQNPWGNFQNPWSNFQNPWGNNSNTTATDRKKQAEYDKLRNVLNEYKKNLPTDNNDRVLIETALNKSGKIGEKLDALKDVAKKLNSNSIQKALLSMDAIKIELDTAGYKIDDKKSNTELKQNLNNLEADIKAKKADLTTPTVCKSENDPDILRTLSFWNDTHNSNENRNIIRLIANYLPTESGSGTNQITSVNNIAQSLVNYVETAKSHFDSDIDFSKLDKSKQDVSDALAKLLNNCKGTDGKINITSTTKADILTLADKVDDLYARLRLIEAERIKNNLKKEYKVLNDATGKDIVNDKLIVKATEDDLRNEGISIPSSRDTIPYTEEPSTIVREDDDPNETADEKIEKLTKSGDDKALKASAKSGVYQTETVAAGENPKFYTKNDDDKLVELKDVKAIDKDGKCTMNDGSKKSLSEVEKVEVQKADVQSYNDEMKKIKELLNNGTIKKCDAHFKGKNLYKSKGTNENGYPQYFTVVDGELKQIDCAYIEKGGQAVIKEDGTKVTATDFSDYCSISTSEILTEDGKAKAQKDVKEKNAERQKEVDELVKNGKLRTTNCKKPMVYCTPQKVGDRNRHYIISNGEIYELDGVTQVWGNGRCKKDGKVNSIGNTTVIKRVKVSASDIDTNGADSSDSDIAKIAKEENGAYDLGHETAQDLIGYTNDDEYKNVQKRLKAVNKDNVIEFLKGYYSNDGGGNGLFLQLGLETTHFKNKEVVPVIKAFIDAVPAELRDSKEFKEAQRIYRKCATRDNNADFKNFSWGWGWDRIWGVDELDQLDDAIEELLSQMENNTSSKTKESES